MNGAPTRGREHLGVGWAFPVRPSPGGGLSWARYEDDVDQAIGIILQTAPFERVMLSEFGAGLRSYVFAPNTEHTHRVLEEEVKIALRRWEPRIDVERVHAYASADDPRLLLIEIDYVVRRTNTAQNRVFPFYLEEGA